MNMNYLAIDTSGTHLTVIAKGGRGEYTYFCEDCSLRHSVVLMGAIEEALEKADLKKEEIDVFCCCLGPGSFTGIRIGVATAKALAYAFKKKILGVTAFDALAYDNTDEFSLALIDARHGHAYAAGYRGKEEVFSPAYLSAEEISKMADEYKLISSAPIEGIESKTVSLPSGFRAAVEAKLSGASEDLNSVVPLYVRKSQAEEGR